MGVRIFYTKIISLFIFYTQFETFDRFVELFKILFKLFLYANSTIFYIVDYIKWSTSLSPKLSHLTHGTHVFLDEIQ